MDRRAKVICLSESRAIINTERLLLEGFTHVKVVAVWLNRIRACLYSDILSRIEHPVNSKTMCKVRLKYLQRLMLTSLRPFLIN